MSNTTTVIERTNRWTGNKDVVEIGNKAASAGGDTRGRVYRQYWFKLLVHKYKVLGIRNLHSGQFVA
tara:strand:+ start:345 stop:545 length:201 start_codon:yes stop_codon:yes gene_type:complete